MADLLIIVGSGLCVLSILLAIIAVMQTRAPRGAAIALLLGLAAIFVAAKADPAAVSVGGTIDAWKRLFAGEISLSAPPEPVTVTVPEGEVTPNPETPVDPTAIPDPAHEAAETGQ